MEEGKKVINFGRIKSSVDLPNLIEIQLKSFEWFLQPNVAKKKTQGLLQVFEQVFPIESPHEDVVLEFIDYELGEPKYSEHECKERDVTYAAPLKATIRLIRKESMEVREQTVYMGDIPLMSRRGTFVVNGAERVVVNQLHRSPGIFFFFEESDRIYNCRVIPDRGSWLEFEMDNKGHVIARIDRKKKFPVTLLIKALGYENNDEIVKLFYDTSTISLKKEEDYDTLNGKRVAVDVISKDTGEVIIEVGERISIDIIDQIKEEKVSEIEVVEFPNNKEDSYLSNTLDYEVEFIKKNLKVDPENDYTPSELALLTIHAIMRPGEPTNIDNARSELNRLFFNPRSYTLGSVGRYKINNKFGFTNNNDVEILTKEDIVYTVKYILYLIAEAEGYEIEVDGKDGKKKKKFVTTIVDDIDHLGNRRVRSVGELIQNQVKVGFQRMERVIKERMTIQDLDVITPQALISIKPISAVINEFFGSSQLSQFMDQTNPLAELTHKRRLNALGPGGLSRERAGFEVRDVHPSHYGRMCPIETPEGPNIGLIVSLSTFGRINEYGFLETPYRVVENGSVTDDIEYLTADIEDDYFVAQANAVLDEKGNFVKNLIPCRNRGNFPYKKPKEIQYMDVSPNQVFSVSTNLIPFLEHDDANRALMGSNMQRQAVPLMITEAPFVGTGMEPHAAYDSGVLSISDRGGDVIYVDAKVAEVKTSSGEIDR
jgi:DNA-directed RNA polymerase subunit beta